MQITFNPIQIKFLRLILMDVVEAATKKKNKPARKTAQVFLNRIDYDRSFINFNLKELKDLTGVVKTTVNFLHTMKENPKKFKADIELILKQIETGNKLVEFLEEKINDNRIP